ncbi:MAG: histidine kinase [Treponema sp.]|nr:histidine kinase [Treponema sp.]
MTEEDLKFQIDSSQMEMRYKMLSSQINPHFLFNSLETIRMKALSSGDKEVATMLRILASLLRYNLSVEGKPVPLIKELDAIQNYLNIQHFRFGERVSYDIVTTCDVQNIMILPLLIQPIVENSFLHGLENRVSGGFIYIFITNDVNEPDDILITVKDNGCGMDSDKIDSLMEKMNNPELHDESHSIGLTNVNSRIKLFYGEKYGLTIESEVGEGTSVIIRIHNTPKIEEPANGLS